MMGLLQLCQTAGPAHVMDLLDWLVPPAALDDARLRLLSRRSDVPREVAQLVDAAVARDPAARERLDAAQIAGWLRGLATSDW